MPGTSRQVSLCPFAAWEPLGRTAGAASPQRAITGNTVLVVASSPGYPHGLIDDVAGIAAVAKKVGDNGREGGLVVKAPQGARPP